MARRGRIEFKNGDKFNRWTIIGEVEPRPTNCGTKLRMVECVCECGKISIIQLSLVVNGHSKGCASCGAKNRPFRDLKIKINPGDRFHRWTVIKEIESEPMPSGGTKRMVRCQCACGTIRDVQLMGLITDNSKSCGCIKYHWYKNTPTWESWSSMLKRTTNKNHKSYADYGGRGIKVCARWLNFRNFLDDMGERPGPKYSLGRIDNDGGYEKSNCAWVTTTEQANNKRSNRVVEYNGEEMTLMQLVRKTGTNYSTVWSRIVQRNMTAEEAINTPLDIRKSHPKS